MLKSRRGDAGFTLIELVLTVAIVGFVVTALTGVVFNYLRLSSETSTRLNESTDQQFVSAYWQQDVSSLGIRGLPVNGVVPSAQAVWLASAPASLPGACGGQANAVVSFAWDDYKNVPTADPTLTWTNAKRNAAVYYTSTAANANGTTETQLWRRRCGDTNSNIVVARFLLSAPTVTCLDKTGTTTGCASAAPYPATVTMSMSVQDLSQKVHAAAPGTGYNNLVLTAERRQG